MRIERNEDGWDVLRGHLSRADATKGGWEVECEDGGMWGTFWLQRKNSKGIVPKVGDECVFYTSNVTMVRGLDLNGVRLFYATRADADAEAAASKAKRERDSQAELNRERASRDERRAALPQPLQVRLDRYEAANPVWRREYESYELFVCEQAASLAALAKVGDIAAWYERFRALGYEAQRVEWPGMSDQHSGNTFGATVQLAYWLDMGWSDRIINGHGAMVALVGCADYGCHVPVPA